jgi:hypothetical protein
VIPTNQVFERKVQRWILRYYARQNEGPRPHSHPFDPVPIKPYRYCAFDPATGEVIACSIRRDLLVFACEKLAKWDGTISTLRDMKRRHNLVTIKPGQGTRIRKDYYAIGKRA